MESNKKTSKIPVFGIECKWYGALPLSIGIKKYIQMKGGQVF